MVHIEHIRWGFNLFILNSRLVFSPSTKSVGILQQNASQIRVLRHFGKKKRGGGYCVIHRLTCRWRTSAQHWTGCLARASLHALLPAYASYRAAKKSRRPQTARLHCLVRFPLPCSAHTHSTWCDTSAPPLPTRRTQTRSCKINHRSHAV